MIDDLRAVTRFARALDAEDYPAAKQLLSDACEYACRGIVYRGPEAIIASYRGNGDAAQAFDSIDYESHVVRESPRRFRIRFVDDISHAGQRFVFRCEQIVRTDDAGLIARIEHVDLPGQLAGLSKFRALFESVKSGGREC